MNRIVLAVALILAGCAGPRPQPPPEPDPVPAPAPAPDPAPEPAPEVPPEPPDPEAPEGSVILWNPTWADAVREARIRNVPILLLISGGKT